MASRSISLKELHRDIIVRLAAAIGNLRMVALGAPFAAELTDAAESDLQAALAAAREAETMRAEISRNLEKPTFLEREEG